MSIASHHIHITFFCPWAFFYNNIHVVLTQLGDRPVLRVGMGANPDRGNIFRAPRGGRLQNGGRAVPKNVPGGPDAGPSIVEGPLCRSARFLSLTFPRLSRLCCCCCFLFVISTVCFLQRLAAGTGRGVGGGGGFSSPNTKATYQPLAEAEAERAKATPAEVQKAAQNQQQQHTKWPPTDPASPHPAPPQKRYV